MENNENKEKVCIKIGDFLSNNNVCIPMLQRDYAQGRDGKEYIRERFLKEIYDATTIDAKTLILDFIYGNMDSAKKCFYPIDGQQRLTTVWLVYWYIALRAGKLADEKRNLMNFSYETRKSSREFCHQLCEKLGEYKSSTGLIDYIKNQTWFFASWKTDPTISSMLRTLEGTNGKDGIEPLFSEIAIRKDKWERCLERFKENVGFYVLKIKGEALPEEAADQLYVKMNARGKALTDFENFKADFVSFLSKCVFPPNESSKNIPSKIDNEWNDLFWKDSCAGAIDGKTDEVFFAFINRFCLNQLLVKKMEGEIEGYTLKEKYIPFIDEIKKHKTLGNTQGGQIEITSEDKEELMRYDYLSRDCELSYEKFDFYEGLLTHDVIEKLNNVFSGFQQYSEWIQSVLEDINKVVSVRELSNYTMFPRYKVVNGNRVSSEDKAGNCINVVEEITQKGRIYFHSICKFLEDDKFWNLDSFKDWMRVVRNVVENSNIDSVSAMISCIRVIDKLGDYSHNILEYLKVLGKWDGESEMDKQVWEEIQKAVEIANCPEKKKKIIEAETYAFFCGRIGFLFTDADGNVNWDDFDEKYKNSCSYFRSNSVSFEFVRNYCLMFSGFEDASEKFIFHCKGWQRRGDSWLDVLHKCDFYEKTHKILLRETIASANGPYSKFVRSKSFERIVQKKGLFERKENLRLSFHSGKWALFKKYAQGEKLYFDDEQFKRGAVLFDLSKESGFRLSDPLVMINDSEIYYWGEIIWFTFLLKNYAWTVDDTIYGFDSNWNKRNDFELQNSSTLESEDLILKLREGKI